MKPSEKQTEKIDQLFRNKLEEHALAPSENAWAKVEASISKKNNLGAWRIAATILLAGALLAILIWSQRSTDKTPVLAERKTLNLKKENTQPIRSATHKDNKKQTVQQKEVRPSLERSVHTVSQQQPVEQKVTRLEKSNSEPKEIQVASNDKKLEEKEIITTEKIISEATTKTEVASSAKKPIKLEFTLEDVPSEQSVATAEETKTRGLKKVLELAREMKQGEGPVLNFREKKNELFAHNFINGRQKTQ